MKLTKILASCRVGDDRRHCPCSADRDIYPDPSQAKADVAAALKTAAATHKRVIIDFGGNWCGDCQVLDIYFHNPENRPILESNYILVHVNIGHMDENVDIAEHYGVPLNKGVPALAVLSERASCSTARRAANSKPCAAWKPTPSQVSWSVEAHQSPAAAYMVTC